MPFSPPCSVPVYWNRTKLYHCFHLIFPLSTLYAVPVYCNSMKMPHQRQGLTVSVELQLLDAALTKASRERRLAAFLRGLLTRGELSALAQRLHIATMLYHGASYRSIRERTGAALGTITSVHRWLAAEPHYRRVVSLRQKTRQRRPPPRELGNDDFPFSIKSFARRTLGTTI